MIDKSAPREVIAVRAYQGTKATLDALAKASGFGSASELAANVLDGYITSETTRPVQEAHISTAGRRETSQAANASIDKGAIRAKVMETIKAARDGMTCDEVEALLGMSHQTASARVHELGKMGQIVDSGKRRPTRSGRFATVWEARKEAARG